MESEIIRISRATDFTRASSQIIPQRSRVSLIIIHLEILETKTFSKKKKEKDTPLLRIRMWITEIENKSNRFSIFPSENSPARILFSSEAWVRAKEPTHLPRIFLAPPTTARRCAITQREKRRITTNDKEKASARYTLETRNAEARSHFICTR